MPTPSPSFWRKIAAPIIAQVIAEVGTTDPAALRRALRDAYPFGERRLWPYKVWRDEIRRQLNPPPTALQHKAPPVADGQLDLLATTETGASALTASPPRPGRSLMPSMSATSCSGRWRTTGRRRASPRR